MLKSNHQWVVISISVIVFPLLPGNLFFKKAMYFAEKYTTLQLIMHGLKLQDQGNKRQCIRLLSDAFISCHICPSTKAFPSGRGASKRGPLIKPQIKKT
jgi:hypothetical protein